MMTSLEIRVLVRTNGEIVLPAMPDLPPGEYDAVIVLEGPNVNDEREPLVLPVLDMGAWPESLSLRREDMYGDEGR
jgi:hypothetical protein